LESDPVKDQDVRRSIPENMFWENTSFFGKNTKK
jgi:hypothetical protein